MKKSNSTLNLVVSLLNEVSKKVKSNISLLATKVQSKFGSLIIKILDLHFGSRVNFHYEVKCFKTFVTGIDELGNEIRECFPVPKWKESFDNLVVNTGLDEILQRAYKSSGFTADDFVLLTDGTPTVAAADTIGTHAGWVEVTDYDEAVRQDLTLGAISGQSVDNVGNEAVFTIDSDATTIGGAGVVSDDTKGGSSGILIGAGAFTGGDKTADDNDVLNVTVTITESAS